jgi:hypothetical protein
MIVKVKKIVLIDISESTTIGTSSTFNANGVLREIIIVAPALTGNVAYTIELLDEDSYTLFSKATLTHNTTTALTVDANNNYFQHPMHGDMKIRITAAGAQETTDKSFTVAIYYQE